MLNARFSLVVCALMVLYSLDLRAETPLRDPTKPFDHVVKSKAATAKQLRFSLDSILVSSQRRRAIVNGVNLGLGDVIAGMRVQKIEADSVLLANAQDSVELRLRDMNVKKARRPGGLAMRKKQ